VIKKIDENLKKLQKGEVKPRDGHPWVLYLLAHGSNDDTKSVNENTKKLKHFLRDVIVEREMEWLDQTIDGKAGQGWAEKHGCYIVYIWPKNAN
jgi:hypothetical protein